ncbi:hypothetical protein GTP23_12145 [Pseudoduganella sp. FT93W]|uniref:Uncharacterized protein n=1 Tax=Duganella fentianensis TaxID=2692177 RepID=A0A845I4D0_9BURK|nr:hypothetical protein [Duganella fentianensis]MYN45798.1 hypothetical protein [Duganella fentianensis]
MTVAEVVQALMGGGMLAHAGLLLKWVIRVETRLAVIESKTGGKDDQSKA